MKPNIYITSKKINNIKIALLSDIHYSNSFNIKNFNKIIKQIKTIKPDYTVIVGDLVDNTEINYKILYNFLENLDKINKVLICIGNHDISKYKNNKKLKTLKEIVKGNWEESDYKQLSNIVNKLPNTKILDNKTYIDKKNNISITGINLSYNYYKNKETLDLFKKEIKSKKIKLDSNNYNILLIHSPYNIYKYPESVKEYDLVLSGHLHGGLTHPIISKLLPKNKGLISTKLELFPNYVRGRTKTKYFEGYIYEGITKLSESSTKFLNFFDRFFPKKVGYIEINKIDTK